MIHPALYKLIFLQFRASARRMMRGGASPGRVLLFVIGAVICGTWLFSSLMLAQHRDAGHAARVRLAMPLALLGICVMTALTSAKDKAIAFTPGEVDQLFPGPFTRRELLGFKLIKSALAAVLTALVMSMVMLKHALWWPACYAGVFMSLLFVQWFSIALLLGGQAIGNAAFSKFRRLLIVVVLGLIVFAARPWLVAGMHNGEVAMRQFRNSRIGFIFDPFEPFGELMTANTALAVVKPLVLAAVLNGVLLLVIFMLDSYYLETAMAASERRHAKIQRVRTGSFLSVGVSTTANWQLPQLPWLGGAGPIAWRQLTSAARSSRGLLLLLTIVAVGAVPTLAMAGGSDTTFQMLKYVVIWLTFLCSSMLNFDFRGDIDHVEPLKALPLRGSFIVVGQLFVPVLLLSVFHTLLFSLAALAVPAHRAILLAVMIVIVPFNVLLFEAENLIFLLFPSRPAAVSPGDFQVLGRKFIFMAGKIAVLGGGVTLALIPAVFLWILSGKHLIVPALVTWFMLAIESAAMVPLLAWAYRRFDPSIHTPA